MLLTTLYRIGRRPAYSGLFFGTLSATLLAIALFPNAALVSKVAAAEVALHTKVAALLALVSSLPATFSTTTLVIAISFAVLLAFNVTILTYYLQRRRKGTRGTKRLGATSLGGIVSGVLGLGCAACGSIVLSALVSTFGGVGLLALLPFGGGEFAVVGLGLLVLSSYVLLTHINDPLVCRE